MKFMIVVLIVVSACKVPSDRWDGVPSQRACSGETLTGSAMCIAEGKVYQCIRSNGRMLCVQPTVEIKCTNIVNVETVCPVKP